MTVVDFLRHRPDLSGNGFSRTSIRPARLALAAVLSVLAVTVHAQLPVEPLPAEPEQETATWQAPPISNLPVEWWQQFDTISPDIQRQRFERLYKAIDERIQGLDPENLVAAKNSLENLKSLADLLNVTEQSQPEPDVVPVLTQESYDLEEILQLRAQARTVNKRMAELKLQIAQLRRQVNLLESRRQNLLREYQAQRAESPRRLLIGIERVAARVEYELNLRRIEQLTEQLESLEEQTGLIAQQQEYAREHLSLGDTTLEEMESRLADARARITEMRQNVAAAQKQLLDALSVDTVKPALELLRKQQLTRASAEASLAELQEALLRREVSWYRFRSGETRPGEERNISATLATQLIEQTLNQIDVWSATSQATLVASPPRGTLNTIKNFELAQSAARDTLLLTDEIQDTSDDLVLVQDILTEEIIASRSGLSKAWANLKLATGSIWNNISGVIDYKLFSIGDAPVTPGGLFKVLMILLIAYAISRVIRHLLDHATGRQQFARSPAIYTLGRLLHYIIILIGVFAALGSIGMDFTNFALIAGALSVGIGFGLQAIVNNFVSGLILLFEGSLRIGDYIELDSGLAGVVKEINTRATVVNSNDGVDVVVPNSELVTTKLTNWTLRESFGRLRIPFGVAYGSDKDTVRNAALEAANEMDFILLNMKGREPQVRLVGFGDSSLDFELLAWVSRQGIRRPHRVRASYLWALETQLTKAGIEIPFPQRDLHFKNALPSGDDSRHPEEPGNEKTAGSEKQQGQASGSE